MYEQKEALGARKLLDRVNLINTIQEMSKSTTSYRIRKFVVNEGC